MRHKSSIINVVMEGLPQWQVEALQVLRDEFERLSRGDYTECERHMFMTARDLGASSCAIVEGIVSHCIGQNRDL